MLLVGAVEGGLGRHFVGIDAVEPVNISTGFPVLSSRRLKKTFGVCRPGEKGTH